jgi:hypothetical protein
MAINYPGSLKARAAAAGVPTVQFVENHKQDEGNLGKLARLAYFAQGVHGSGEAKNDQPGDNRVKRNPLYQTG